MERRERVVRVLLVLPVMIAVSSVVILLDRLIDGRSAELGDVLLGGTRLFFATAATYALVAGIIRWAHWFGSRRT